MSPMQMNQSAWAVPGAWRPMEMVPSMCFSPVFSVLSWAMGGSTFLGSFCRPPWIEP